MVGVRPVGGSASYDDGVMSGVVRHRDASSGGEWTRRSGDVTDCAVFWLDAVLWGGGANVRRDEVRPATVPRAATDDECKW